MRTSSRDSSVLAPFAAGGGCAKNKSKVRDRATATPPRALLACPDEASGPTRGGDLTTVEILQAEVFTVLLLSGGRSGRRRRSRGC